MLLYNWMKRVLFVEVTLKRYVPEMHFQRSLPGKRYMHNQNLKPMTESVAAENRIIESIMNQKGNGRGEECE